MDEEMYNIVGNAFDKLRSSTAPALSRLCAEAINKMKIAGIIQLWNAIVSEEKRYVREAFHPSTTLAESAKSPSAAVSDASTTLAESVKSPTAEKSVASATRAESAKSPSAAESDASTTLVESVKSPTAGKSVAAAIQGKETVRK